MELDLSNGSRMARGVDGEPSVTREAYFMTRVSGVGRWLRARGPLAGSAKFPEIGYVTRGGYRGSLWSRQSCVLG